jgi:hypothetical protein
MIVDDIIKPGNENFARFCFVQRQVMYYYHLDSIYSNDLL